MYFCSGTSIMDREWHDLVVQAHYAKQNGESTIAASLFTGADKIRQKMRKQGLFYIVQVGENICSVCGNSKRTNRMWCNMCNHVTKNACFPIFANPSEPSRAYAPDTIRSYLQQTPMLAKLSKLVRKNVEDACSVFGAMVFVFGSLGKMPNLKRFAVNKELQLPTAPCRRNADFMYYDEPNKMVYVVEVKRLGSIDPTTATRDNMNRTYAYATQQVMSHNQVYYAARQQWLLGQTTWHRIVVVFISGVYIDLYKRTKPVYAPGVRYITIKIPVDSKIRDPLFNTQPMFESDLNQW